MKKAFKIGMSAVIAILIAAAIIYRIPQNISKEMTVCSLSGMTKTVKMELTVQKYLLRPTELKGNVYVDGKEFCSVYGYKNSDGDWEYVGSTHINEIFKLKEKYFMGYNNLNATFKVTEDIENIAKMGNNGSLEIHSKDSTYDKIALWLYEPEIYPDHIAYYGPAETAEEAEAMMNEIYDVAEEA